MSVYIEADNDGPEFLASNIGWLDVTKWIGNLAEDHPELELLAEHGWSQQPDAMLAELESAMNYHPPSDVDVLHTLEIFQKFLQDNTCEVVSVSDGLSNDQEPAV